MILGSDSGACQRSFASGNVSCGEPDLALSANITARGAHGHAMSGGDAETRPINVYVHYLIKI